MSYTGTPEQQIEVIKRASEQRKKPTLPDGIAIVDTTVDNLPDLEAYYKGLLKTSHDGFESQADNTANLETTRIVSKRIAELKAQKNKN